MKPLGRQLSGNERAGVRFIDVPRAGAEMYSRIRRDRHPDETHSTPPGPDELKRRGRDRVYETAARNFTTPLRPMTITRRTMASSALGHLGQ